MNMESTNEDAIFGCPRSRYNLISISYIAVLKILQFATQTEKSPFENTPMQYSNVEHVSRTATARFFKSKLALEVKKL